MTGDMVKTGSTCSFLLTLGRSVILLSFDMMLHRKKQSKSSPLDKKFQNYAQDLPQVVFNDSVRGNQKLGSPVTRLQRFNFISFYNTYF